MLENEIESSDVADESSESSESQSESSTEGNEQQGQQKEAALKTEETPFHEHPRFKELVEQKNQALASQRALESKLAQLEAKFSQPQAKPVTQAEKDELIEDLKKIDPRLAARLEAFGKSSSTIEQLQAKLEQFEKNSQQQVQQQIVKESVSKINSWHDVNKVPAQIKTAINAQLDTLYMQGKLNPDNLEQSYKEAYEPYKAFMEEIKREALKSYVPAKKADASTPASQPKGTPAKPATKKTTWAKDPEQAKSQIVQRFLKQQAALKEAE